MEAGGERGACFVVGGGAGVFGRQGVRDAEVFQVEACGFARGGGGGGVLGAFGEDAAGGGGGLLMLMLGGLEAVSWRAGVVGRVDGFDGGDGTVFVGRGVGDAYGGWTTAIRV